MSWELRLAAQHSTRSTPVQLDLAQIGSDRFNCAVVSFNSPTLFIFSWSVSPMGEVQQLARSSVVLPEPCVSVTHVHRTNDPSLPARSVRFLVSLRSGLVKQVAPVDEDDDDAAAEFDPETAFRVLPYNLSEPATWDSATQLYGQPNVVATALVAPVSGAEDAGVCSIRVLQLQHDGHLRPVRSSRVAPSESFSQSVGGVGGQSLTRLQPVQGDSNGVMALCGRSILQIDLRSPSPALAVVDVLQWSCHDPLASFSAKDSYVFGGAESGAVVIWDVRNASQALAESTPSSNNAVVGIHAISSASFATAGADGVVQQWFRKPSVTGEFTAHRIDHGSGMLPLGSVPAVDLVAQGGLICTVDASGVLSIFGR
jgi:hypothetical protein